jgi:hypothetical protein
MTAIVVGTFGRLIDESLTPNLRPYFNGTLDSGKDFIDNSANQASLVNRLVTFFGQAAILNCTDGSVGAYVGNPNMKTVHQNMPIGVSQFNAFNDRLIYVLNAAGVTTADQAAVRGVLDSTKGDICNQADCESDSSSKSAATFLAPVFATVLFAIIAMF